MLLLLCALASASQITLQSDAPVGVWLDGVAVPYVPGTLTAVAADVPAGTHMLVLGDASGRVVYGAEIALPENADARVRWSRGRFALIETVALPVPPALVVDVTSRVRAGRVPMPSPLPPVVVGAPPAGDPTPVAQAPSVVEFSSIDGEWANVRVDGELVAEFRNGDAKKAVTLDPGPHTVEVRSFMDDDVWAKGTLIVSGGGTIKVGIAEGRAPEVYNRPGAWRAP